MDRYQTAALPWLHDWMLANNATNERLAEKAGVSLFTVAKARLGEKISAFMIECITGAMKFKYHYHKRGRKRKS